MGSIPYSYSWTPADSVTGSDILNPQTTAEDSTQFILTVTDSKSCVKSDTIMVNVIHYEINAGVDSSICLGDSLTIILDTNFVQGVLPYTYLWSPNTSLSDTTVYNPVASPVDSICCGKLFHIIQYWIRF